MTGPAGVKVEILPYDAAPWAPRHPGAVWAFRLTNKNGNTILGTSVRPRREVETQTRQLAARMAEAIARYAVASNGYPTPKRPAWSLPPKRARGAP